MGLAVVLTSLPSVSTASVAGLSNTREEGSVRGQEITIILRRDHETQVYYMNDDDGDDIFVSVFDVYIYGNLCKRTDIH